MLHDTRFVDLPFTVFYVVTFVVLFLTLSHADFHFTPGIFPVQRQGDDGVTFAVDAAKE
ncbi:hypothetical protein D3C87_1819640 [compost metagenome]